MKHIRTITIIMAAAVFGLCAILSGCSTPAGSKKIIVDASPIKPDWVDNPAKKWKTDDGYFFKAKQTIRGDQRVNGGFIIAGNDTREMLMRGIYDEMKGAIDEAQTSLNENAEFLMGKVRSGQWEGALYGFSEIEQYFERYEYCNQLTKECDAKIDCWILSNISLADYNKTKNAIVNQVVAIDPRIKEAVTNKQIKFFAPKEDRPVQVEASAQGGTEESETPRD